MNHYPARALRRASVPSASLTPLSKCHKKAPRSRNGCWTCRNRKIKCDEMHPRCTPCTRLRISCDYSRRLNYKDDTPRILSKMSSVTDTVGCPVYDGSAPRIFSPYQPVLWHEYEAEHDNGFVNISMDDFVDDQCSALLADDSHQLQSFNYDDSDEEFDDDDDHLSQQARARAKANSMPMVYSSMQEQSMMLPPTSSLAPHAEFRYYPEPSAFKSEFVNSSPSPVIATSVDDDSSWYYNHNTNRPSPSSLRQIEVSPQSTSLPASSLSVPNSWSDSASTCSSWSRPSSSPSSPLEPLHNDNSVAESGDLFLDLSTSAMNIPLGQQQQQQYQAYPREVPSASLSLQHLQQQIPQQELDELNSVLLSGSSSTTLEAYLRTMLSPSDKAADGGLAYSNQNLNNHPRKLQQQSFAPMPMLQPETGTEMLYYMNTNMTY
ncbi:uncharacterized protein V2V93DRAFT_369828 [Kockiozyma suomiensis]|uniref:uncharacterized protein n=1 Tax=Kockiozyma suomiensis TaxID=1337062 RepID=UPI0033433FAE